MMAHFADEPLPTPNSEQEYVDGIAKDGKPLEIVSKHLIPPYVENEMRPPIGPHAPGAAASMGAAGEAASPHLLEADNKILAAERAHIERVRKCVKLYEGTVDLGEPARQILAAQAELALLREQTAIEFERRRLERLKNTPIDQLVEGEAAPVNPPAQADDASGIAFQAMSGESFQLSQAGHSPASARKARGQQAQEQDGCEATSREARSAKLSSPGRRCHARAT